MKKTGLSYICAAMAAVTASAAGCGSDDQKACDPVANTGCDGGKVCEAVKDADPICAAPVVLRGKVLALPEGSAVGGARVVALDANGAPVSAVATVGSDGSYELRVPSLRAADGSVIGENVTLRADAANFVSFPSGIRFALPIDTRTAVLTDGKLVIASALTEIGLIKLANAPNGSIAGKVAVPPSRAGVLVVAEGGPKALTAVADSDGDYRIFNVAPGAWTVKAYAHGVNYDPASATVVATTASANLSLSSKPTSKVTGKVDIVDPEGAGATSVILVVESTFDETLARGEAPAGLRAGNVLGDFTIDGVPEGRYVVLAGFENDNLVRDPDTGIGGTAIVHIGVTSGADTAAGASFKVTGARDNVSPGNDGPEMVTGKPMLSWEDDSSEDEYDVVVFDALGQKVWEKPHVPRETSKNPSIPYEGPLDRGMYYQFRALSLRDKGGTLGVRPISSTEDLRGVFYMP